MECPEAGSLEHDPPLVKHGNKGPCLVVVVIRLVLDGQVQANGVGEVYLERAFLSLESVCRKRRTSDLSSESKHFEAVNPNHGHSKPHHDGVGVLKFGYRIRDPCSTFPEALGSVSIR